MADDEKAIQRETTIRLGRKARDVLASEAFQSAMDEIMWDLHAQFLSTTAEDAVTRERLWATGQAMSSIKNKLDSFVEVGKVEERNKALDAEQ